MDDTIDLQLDGRVPLTEFATAISNLEGLIDALTDEISGGEAFEWEIAQLNSGSAFVKIRAISEDKLLVDETIRAYDAVAEALHRREPIPYSLQVAEYAYNLTALINGKIKAVSFGTHFHKFRIEETVTPEEGERRHKWLVAWGALRGEVKTVSVYSNSRLALTISEALTSKAVKCYLPNTPSYEEQARQAWKKEVLISGRIYRRSEDGQPVKIQDVVNIQPVSPPSGSYRQARGIISYTPGDPLPEERIRLLRDAIDN